MVRTHLRRIKDIFNIGYPDHLWRPAGLSTDHFSASLYSALPTTAANDENFDPTLASASAFKLSSLYENLNRKVGSGVTLSRAQPIECVKSITLSAWNPPTCDRAMLGDLAYICITTLENRKVHITSHIGGFYINR